MKLSVIVPVFKVEKYLRECVESVLNQTFSQFELILVDDGSPDGCPAICDEYEAKDSRVKVIHKENGGLVSARKAGLSAASGDFIGFVDGDDWIEPDMYASMVKAACDHNADIVICDIAAEGKGGTVYMKQDFAAGFRDKKGMEQEIYPKMMFNGAFGGRGIHPSLCSKIFKRTLLEKNLYAVNEQIGIGEDMACSYPCLLDARRIFIMDGKYFYHYRKNEGSMIMAYKNEFFERYMILYSGLRDIFIRKNYPRMQIYNQANLCYCAALAVENEFVPGAPGKAKDKLRLIKKIVGNNDVAEALKAVRFSRCDIKYRVYLWLMRTKSSYLLFIANAVIRKLRNKR